MDLKTLDFALIGGTLLNVIIFAGILIFLGVLQKKHASFAKRVLIALVLGVALGVFLHLVFGHSSGITKSSIVWISAVGNTYVRLLRMIVYPLVFVSILSSIIGLKEGDKLGKMGGNVIGFLMLTVAASALIGVLLTHFSGLRIDQIQQTAATEARGQYLETRLSDTVAEQPIVNRIVNMIPTNPFDALTGNGSTATIATVIFATFLGIAFLGVRRKKPEEAETFEKIIKSLQAVVMRMVTLVLRLTPYGVAALIAKVLATSDFESMVGLLSFVVLSYIGIFLIFVVQMVLISVYGFNPMTYLKKSWPTLLFAFTSRSSAGTMPLTITTLKRDLGVDTGLANLTGSISPSIGQNACAGLYPAMLVALIAPSLGINPLNPVFLLEVLVIITLGSFGVAGIGGGATFAALIVLSALNFPVALAGLLIAVEPLIDMARTAANVSGAMVSGLVSAKRLDLVDTNTFADMETLNVEVEG